MIIALLTIWHCGNYGAEMQAYATKKALEQLGHQVEMIDFPLNIDKQWSIKTSLVRLIFLVSPAGRKFKSFWHKSFPNVSRTYISTEDLRIAPPQADMYMVGSDQVWNEAITRDHASAYFLDFGDEKVQRVSFSSSFGVSTWRGTSGLTEIAFKCLSKFSHISCREKTGINILKETFNVDNVENTLDPTLLFREYPEITGNFRDNHSVVFYPLSSYDHSLLPIAQKVASLFETTYINANPYCLIPKTSIVWNRKSIQEWMRNIAGARFVLTRSFHGLVFSLLYHREFAIINLTDNGKQSRILDLLNAIGLGNRYFTSESSFLNSEVLKTPIDYDVVDVKLEKLREKSWDFLRRI